MNECNEVDVNRLVRDAAMGDVICREEFLPSRRLTKREKRRAYTKLNKVFDKATQTGILRKLPNKIVGGGPCGGDWNPTKWEVISLPNTSVDCRRSNQPTGYVGRK